MRILLIFNFNEVKLHVFEYNQDMYRDWLEKEPDGDLFQYICMWYDLDLKESECHWMEIDKFAPIYHEFYDD